MRFSYRSLVVLTFATVTLFAGSELRAQCTWTGNAVNIFTSCNVGVGTATPNFLFEVVKSGGNVQIAGSAFSASGGAINFLGRGARGSFASPTGSLAGDILMLMGGRGYVTGTGFGPSSVSRITFRAQNDFNNTSQGGVITFDTIDQTDGSLTLTERARFTSDGVMLIGRTTKSSPPPGFNNVKLDVAGDIFVSGNVNAKYQDFAEWVPVQEEIPAGTVVVLNRDRVNEVMPSAQAYDTAVAGVVSAQPGIILGEPSDSKAKIATSGRVKVRVDASQHPIQVGDLLVTSDHTGMAMRSEPIQVNGRSFHQPGTIIGKALEPLGQGQGEILVLLSLQ